uniref:Glycoside hydrolase n=2 Tax=Paracidobacterium acidisoli TaxID=2303751 RepID=A0A372ILC7_9BACT
MQQLREGFAHPPDDARVMMRWWWFGPAVEAPELARELETMNAGGIGGVEIQPVYPMELDDPAKGFRNLTYLSPEFLDRVRYANDTARRLGMRVSLTLGSGWPYGGSYVPVTHAAGMLHVVAEVVAPGMQSVAAPSIRNGEKLLAAFLAAGTPEHYDAAHTEQISTIEDGRLRLPTKMDGAHIALFFVSSRTGQQVKRAAVGAEGFVLNHFSEEAVEDHLHTVAEPLLRAFGDHPPSSVFSDSLEVYGSDWTPDMLEEFRHRRGYDLTPYLPLLAVGTGPKAEDVRYDWGRTLAELIDEHYLAPINAWAREHHTEFRSQSYGTPAVTLSSNALVDLPEGEGSQWHSFSYTRWATSASHVYGRPITSTETWTWLHSPAFHATPLDMKAEADAFFLQGSNQLVGHGWPYSPPSAGEPGWSFYAAAVFNEHNPWWIVMPEVTRYLQRMSWLLRQGKPANDVAVLLPEEDAQARFRPGHVSITDEMPKLLGPDLIPAILDSGYNFDFIDSAAIDREGIHYPILVMPALEHLPLETYRRIEAYVRNGGTVVAVGHAPSKAPGLMEAKQDSAAVAQISEELFQPGAKNSRLVPDAKTLPEALDTALKPDVALRETVPQIGFIHRRLPDADLYFVANTDNEPHTAEATFRTDKAHAEWLDAFTGEASGAGDGHTLKLALRPYESRVIMFTNERWSGERTRAESENVQALQAADMSHGIDIRHGWKVTFDRSGLTEEMQTLHSWADEDATKCYSGTATYVRTVDAAAALLKARVVLLDFGEGTPVERTASHYAGSRAWLEGPVREAAVVYVNGKEAGTVWHPPYAVDIRPLLHQGANELKIVVANTAINEMAGRAAPDYRLLNLRYGERFTPQDMDHLQPLPSGILGPLRLVPEE